MLTFLRRCFASRYEARPFAAPGVDDNEHISECVHADRYVTFLVFFIVSNGDGLLIVQDLVVVVVMIVLTAFGQDTGGGLGHGVVDVLLKGAGLLGAAWLLMRYVLPWLLPHIARMPDLLVLFGVAYAASMAATSCPSIWMARHPNDSARAA